MILIKDDNSYLSKLDLAAINSGIAEKGVHSLRITNFFTDEQKEHNRRTAEAVTREQWSEICNTTKQETAEKVEKVIEAIHKKFMVYQYKNDLINYRKDNWDLYFWCNSGDMSYVTLNPNTKRSNEQQLETVNAVLELIKEVDIEGIQVSIQYTAIYNDQKVSEIVTDYCEKVKDTFIDYGGYVGKIVKTENGYLFRKKGAKKQAYFINNNAVLKNVFSL